MNRLQRAALAVKNKLAPNGEHPGGTVARVIQTILGGDAFTTDASGNATITPPLTVTDKLTLGAALVGSVQALAAAGAVNLTTRTTTIATSGAIALTLADGVSGQEKVISMITDGGDATLTPAHMQGGTTITFNDVGDTVTLVFVGTKWAIIGNTGASVA